jgi:outer membrane murein-binding lipoprotein Lpp
MLIGLVMLAMLLMPGCGDPMTEGILIGLGTSTASSEATDMAQESKTALVAKILQLQQDLEAAATPEQQAALREQLEAAQKKQELAELTSTIADTVKAGLERDWGDKPASPDNLAWILGSAATVLGGIAGKKTLDDRKHVAAINRVKVASKSGDLTTGAVYKEINGA